MSKTIQIGCKLPNGIVLHHPLDMGKEVTLQGLNKSQIIGATHVMNDVDADFWRDWESVHKDFEPLKSGAIFVGKDTTSGKTGFEPMLQNSEGVKTAVA